MRTGIHEFLVDLFGDIEILVDSSTVKFDLQNLLRLIIPYTAEVT